jgi:hypothetical protein
MENKYRMGLVMPAIRDRFGDHIAFAPSLDETGEFWVLSIVKKDEPGHWPLPYWACMGTEEFVAHAADLANDELGLTRLQAAAWVASSMRGVRS